MALVSCPECQAQVSDRAASCPRCGFPLPAATAPSGYPCPVCGQWFDSERKLALHKIDGHPAPTPAPTPAPVSYAYPCPFCDEGFDEGEDLYRHKKTVHYAKGAPPPVWVDKPAAGETGTPTVYGGWVPNAALVCPHCHVTGQVATRRVKAKKGISGGKATGALLTGGLSLLATGLSRKEKVTEAVCHNCKATWIF